jgi:hypothetical protein
MAHCRHHLSYRSSTSSIAIARSAAGAMLAASALFTAGCNAPVSPTFELTFEGVGVTSCGAAAAHDIRLMCDSKVRVRILDTNGIRDIVPAVCQDISSLEIGTMEALSQLDIAFEGLPLGPAMVQVEIWRGDWLDSTTCSLTGVTAPITLEPGDGSSSAPPEPLPVVQPAVVGTAWFEIGSDAHVRIPLTCPDLAQVNRFAAGCGLDVEVSDLDRGIKLRQDGVLPDPDHPGENAAQSVARVSTAVTGSAGAGIDLEALDVQYVLIEETASGGWRPGAGEWMMLDVRDDGSAVWRAWPSNQFWQSFTRSRTVCIEVKERSADGTPGWPQVSCFQVGAAAASTQRLEASYLPPDELQCLLAASGAGAVPADGIVIGRVVEPAEPDEVQPAANVQVLPTPADLPREPLPRLAPIPGGPDEPDLGLDVQYVSKESEQNPRAQACHVDDATATTPSGYFLSDASFPAHWQFATGTGQPGTEGDPDSGADEPQPGTGDNPGRILVGGRIPDKISIVRIQLP